MISDARARWIFRVPESQLHTDPSVFAAITKLKAGQVTEILPVLDAQTRKPAGYAVYKLISREAAGQRDINRLTLTLREGGGSAA